jgi:hypothetical protein
MAWEGGRVAMPQIEPVDPKKSLAPSGAERFARCLSVPFSRETD